MILCDADTIPNLHSVMTAATSPGHGVTRPFDTHRHIPASWVTKPDLSEAPIIEETPDSAGGIWVMTTRTYWNVGGCDERFAQWGGEDVSFWYAAETLVGAERTPGICYSFWQDTDRTTWDRATCPISRQYEIARGRPWMMREILANRM